MDQMMIYKFQFQSIKYIVDGHKHSQEYKTVSNMMSQQSK